MVSDVPPPTAQRDNVCSMVRLGTETKVRPSLETLATYVKELLNSESNNCMEIRSTNPIHPIGSSLKKQKPCTKV